MSDRSNSKQEIHTSYSVKMAVKYKSIRENFIIQPAYLGVTPYIAM